MGVCLHSEDRAYEMDMGYGTFFHLRSVIAGKLDSEFGALYTSIPKCRSKDDYDELNAKMNQVIADKKLEAVADVLDFLFASDCEGEISTQACGKIFELVKDYSDNMMYGYQGTNNSFEDFKQMLKECNDTGQKVIWS